MFVERNCKCVLKQPCGNSVAKGVNRISHLLPINSKWIGSQLQNYPSLFYFVTKNVESLNAFLPGGHVKALSVEGARGIWKLEGLLCSWVGYQSLSQLWGPSVPRGKGWGEGWLPGLPVVSSSLPTSPDQITVDQLW